MAKPTNTNSSRDAIPRRAAYVKRICYKALVCLCALFMVAHYVWEGQHLWDSGGGRAFVPSLLAFLCAVLGFYHLWELVQAIRGRREDE